LAGYRRTGNPEAAIMAGTFGGIVGGALGGGLFGALFAVTGPLEEIKYAVDFTTGGMLPINTPNFMQIDGKISFYFTSIY